MPTECSAESFDFGKVEGRPVEAAFDAGLVTSDAGALLLGSTDRAIGMMDRFAACFHDERRADLIEHDVATLVGQRVFAIALGYEDLNDHDELRHDPMMAVLAGKLEARREDCAPVAGKSTLNRLELSKLEPTRYHKISHNPVAIKNLLVDLFLEAHERPPKQLILDLDATDDPLHGEQDGRFFHGYYRWICLSCGNRRLMRHESAPPTGITFASDGPAAASAAFHQHRKWTMCDYSLQNVKSRPAQVGDKLETRNFGTGTTGFCDAADRDVAVCLLPGTEIAFDEPARKHPFSEAKTFDKVAIFRQFHKDNPHRHHDFLEFPNGEVELLTLLGVSQRATVLQLPAAPKTEAEREEQCRAEYAG